MPLLADAVVLLRVIILLPHPQASLPLDDLNPWQLNFVLEP